jgi:hypothetical protein
MSEKNRLKKDGSDKNKENQGRREAESYAEIKRDLSASDSKGKPKVGGADASAQKSRG